jgi:hypothetical protein
MGEDVDHAAVSVIDGRLSFMAAPDGFARSPSVHYYTIDDQPGYALGDLSTLSDIHRFVSYTIEILNGHADPVMCYCGQTRDHLIRSVFLLCSFRLMELHLTPDDAIAPFTPFRLLLGETSTPSARTIGVRLIALDRAVQTGWFDPNTFSLDLWQTPYFTVCVPNRLITLKFTPETVPPEFLNAIQPLSITKISGKADEEPFVTALNLGFAALDFGDTEQEPPRCLIPQVLDIIAQEQMIAMHTTPQTADKIGILIACSLVLQSGFDLADAVAWMGLCGMPLTSPLSLSCLKKRVTTLKKHNRWAPKRLKKGAPHVVESQLNGPVVKSRRVAEQKLDPLYVLNGRQEGLSAFVAPSQSMLCKGPRRAAGMAAAVPAVGKMNVAQSVNLGKITLAPDMLRQFQSEFSKK